MKENFESTVQFIIKEEGGQTVDHAGATNMGITIGLMRSLKLDLNHDGVIDEKDVALVDQTVVSKVIREQFWNLVGGDNLPTGIDLITCDFAYNAGPAAAKAILSATDPASYTLRRQMFYWDLRCKNPQKYGPYFAGWIGRTIRAWQKAEELKKQGGIA
ncbi:MAG: hypothetical protein LBQ00_06745 [Syntrophobacterales bacterium]|nr:hypothetical protein [Syntrophobacterales bacterium]